MMEEKKKTKRRRGDRRDGVWLRDLDPMHAFTPYMFPNRCDNEAFINNDVDMTAVEDWLVRKNAENPEYPYTFFHLVAAALVKAFVLRPKMNRFIIGRRTYQRNSITLAFVVKKEFKDNGGEALAYLTFDENSTVESVHDTIMKEIHTCRHGGELDNSTAGMELLNKLPRPVLSFIMNVFNHLDYHGRMIQSLIETDPNRASIFISNLGSIGLQAGYHHLTNWGTTSLFVVIGRKEKKPVFDEEGGMEMKPILPMGLTLDERIADGYYYSKTVRLLNFLLTHPEELEKPATTPVEY